MRRLGVCNWMADCLSYKTGRSTPTMYLFISRHFLPPKFYRKHVLKLYFRHDTLKTYTWWHGPCAYPDCKFPELPLTRVCANCRVLQEHHLCQIDFEERVDLDNISNSYCYKCYRSKPNLHVCSSTKEEMPPHINLGDDYNNEGVVDTNGHESGTVIYQWYNGRPSEVSSPDLSGCVDKQRLMLGSQFNLGSAFGY